MLFARTCPIVLVSHPGPKPPLISAKTSDPVHVMAVLGFGWHAKMYGGWVFPADFDFKATLPFYAEALRLGAEKGNEHTVEMIRPVFAHGRYEASNLRTVSVDEMAKHLHQRNTFHPVVTLI